MLGVGFEPLATEFLGATHIKLGALLQMLQNRLLEMHVAIVTVIVATSVPCNIRTVGKIQQDHLTQRLDPHGAPIRTTAWTVVVVVKEVRGRSTTAVVFVLQEVGLLGCLGLHTLGTRNVKVVTWESNGELSLFLADNTPLAVHSYRSNGSRCRSSSSHALRIVEFCNFGCGRRR